MSESNSSLGRGGYAQFSTSLGKLFWMIVGVFAVVGLVIYGRDVLRPAYEANIQINTVILVILAVGCLYSFHAFFQVRSAARWFQKYQTATKFDDLSSVPALIQPVAHHLKETPGEMKLTAVAARSMLDSISSRLAESGDFVRYLGRLLIFVGLLGTFIGLLQTLGGVVDIVSELADATGGEGSIAAMFTTMRAPLEGMGTAFSSSVFGISGSLILGFFDLQVSGAQNRLYNDTENWLAKMSRVTFAGGGDGSQVFASQAIEALADDLRELLRAIKRSEDARIRDSAQIASDRDAMQGDLRREFKTLADTIATLMERRK